MRRHFWVTDEPVPLTKDLVSHEIIYIYLNSNEFEEMNQLKLYWGYFDRRKIWDLCDRGMRPSLVFEYILSCSYSWSCAPRRFWAPCRLQCRVLNSTTVHYFGVVTQHHRSRDLFGSLKIVNLTILYIRCKKALFSILFCSRSTRIRLDLMYRWAFCNIRNYFGKRIEYFNIILFYKESCNSHITHTKKFYLMQQRSDGQLQVNINDPLEYMC